MAAHPEGRAGSAATHRLDGDMKLVFRAVSAGGGRRGIRLENIFWNTISAMAAARRQTVGDLVAGTADLVPAGGNLASTLRVAAAGWLRERVAAVERAAAADNVYAIVHASPSPAFVLTADKRIVQYNQAFLNFLQARLLATEAADLMRTVRLALDVQIEQVIDQLTRDPRSPVSTGFALGVAERRVRGQLKLALAPTSASAMVIAFITQT